MTKWRSLKSRWRWLIAVVGVIGVLTLLPVVPLDAQSTDYSLRFYGHGTGDIDRVKISIDNPVRPADVGATDFTFEFWMKANAGENTGVASCNQNGGWITANIIIDRDVYGAGDYGDYGIALSNGRIAFGVSVGSTGTTLCGATNVADGAWHHIAVTRDRNNGNMQLYVDGQLDGQASGPAGDSSYRDGRTTSFPNSDPFLVIGAEKHDAGSQYPSYRGWVDEIRLSNAIRYSTNFARPTVPFLTDAQTVALYHMNEGPAGACTGTVIDSSGASGGPSNGTCNYGGSAPAGPVYSTDNPFPPPTSVRLTNLHSVEMPHRWWLIGFGVLGASALACFRFFRHLK